MKNELIVKFKDSAFRHGINKEDILYVIANPIYEDILEFYPEKYLVIGFDRNRNLLEIAYKLENDIVLKVFHAMKCRKCYFSLLNIKFWR